jgi:YfiH family protein
MPMQLYPFSLSFEPSPVCALLPLVMNGEPLSSPRCALSSRIAGDMRAESGNREPFLRFLGLEPDQTRSCVQAHSRIVLDTEEGFDSRSEADGMIGRGAPLAAPLAVIVADCLPVFLYDTETRAYALLHSGWKGTGIVLAALSMMAQRWGTRPASVAALLGPCIRPCCYQVGEERAAAFEAEFGGTYPFGDRSLEAKSDGEYPLGPVVRRIGGRPSLDLQAANARLLAGAGVRNLSYCVDCTFTDERLGSFRREGPGYTRMLAVLGYFEADL